MKRESNMRESIHSWFMRIAHLVADRSTCNRKHVGAVLTINKRIVSTGYNGSLPGEAHCDEVGCDTYQDPIHGETCLRTIHAEKNAINYAALNGVSTRNSVAYVTCFPCYRCLQDLIMAGVSLVYYDDDYEDVRNKTIKSIELIKI